MHQSLTEARREWCKSTLRQMELAGYEPTEVLEHAFNQYIGREISFAELCVIMKDEGE